MLFICLTLIGLLHPFVQAQSCVTPYQEEGQCIDIKYCPPLLATLEQQGVGAAEYLRPFLCRFENNVAYVCCPNNYISAVTTEDPPRVSKSGKQNTYGPLYPPFCGYSSINHNKIVNGQKAQLGAWPWAAALGFWNKKNPSEPRWLCGGSLISARHVLTAGHCAIVNDLYVVRVGDLNLKRDDDGAHPIQVEIQQKILHPEYKGGQFVNDIAVLRLTQDITFTDYVYPVCLPVGDSVRNRNFDLTRVFVIGWGAVGTHQPASDILQEAQLPVRRNDECKESYLPFKHAVIDNRIICAGYSRGQKDACQGDSGGPLLWSGNVSTYYQLGVVSYGYKCAEPGFPGVYTRVTEFLDFIISTLQ